MRQGQKSQSRVRHQRSIGRYNSPYQRGGTIFQMPTTSFGMPTYRRYRLDPTIIRAIRQRRQPKGGKVHKVTYPWVIKGRMTGLGYKKNSDQEVF